MLLMFIVRLLAAVAISGQWGLPVLCMEKNLEINNPTEIDQPAITAIDKKTPNKKLDQEVLPRTVVNSKVVPRSALDTKELVKIFNIAYSSNESRVLSQPLNHYELPDEESVKRDFRNVKIDNVDNVDAELQKKGFSSASLVTKNLPKAEVHKIITNVCVNVGKPLHAHGNIFSKLVSEVGEVSEAMVYTVKFLASSLKNKFETFGSKGLKFDIINNVGMIIVFIICCVCLYLLFHIFHNTLLSLTKNSVSSDCEVGNNSYTMRKLHLRMGMENDNNISQIDANDNEDALKTGNKKDDVGTGVYPPVAASIKEVLQEAQKV